MAGNRIFFLSQGMGMILFADEPHQYEPLPDESIPFASSPNQSNRDAPLSVEPQEEDVSPHPAPSKREKHEVSDESTNWLVDWITFHGPVAAGILKWLGIEGSLVFDLQFPSILANDLEEMRDVMHSSKPTVKMDLSCLMYKLLSDLYWSLPAGHAQSRIGQYQRLEPVLQYIEKCFGDPLTLDQLADIACISTRHLCYLFREILHVRPFWYLNTVRLNRSKRLLLEDRMVSISSVALICGYPNICYFNQLFKKHTGLTPTAFRSMH